MIVVDTSVWVGTLLAEDAHFAESTVWFETWVAKNFQIHLPMLMIPELAGVLTRKGTPALKVASAVGEIIDRTTIDLHALDLAASLLAARIATSTGLKGADAVFVALASWLGVPLLSWDRQQRERGGLFCRTMTPVEAMEMAG